MSEFVKDMEKDREEEDEDFDEDEADVSSDIQLGFAEKQCNPLFLNTDWRSWDGGKIGGLPIWLDFEAIPLVEDLQCANCKDPMSFLLQIYSPLDNVPSAFHRAIYIFCCRKPSCVVSKSGFKCFRAQLPKVNHLYPSDPSSENDFQIKAMDTLQGHLCALCGCRATSICSRCRSIKYCGKLHQKQHWKTHKKCCTENAPLPSSEAILSSSFERMELDASQQGILFPEYEVVVEPEDENAASLTLAVASEGHVTTEEILAKVPESCNVWEDAVKSSLTPGGEDEEIDKKITQQDYNNTLSEQKYDQTYINFLTRIDRGGSQQVMRYNAASLHRSDHKPVSLEEVSLEMQEKGRLYVSKQAQQTATRVPPCPHCGSARTLEFQIMPQILHYLGVDKHTLVKFQEEDNSSNITDSDDNTPGDKKALKKSGKIENHFQDDLDWGTIDVYTCLGSCDSGLQANTCSPAGKELLSISHYITEHIELQEIPDLVLPPTKTDAIGSASSDKSSATSIYANEA